ncbi:UNVERIFIED_CONTAM: hypothetical protein HDU68_006249, partial [Siphonaria sp. JEL0065]
MVNYFMDKLGAVYPSIGTVMKPADVACDRTLSKDDYSEPTSLPLPRMLNHMRQATSDVFDNAENLQSELERRGRPGNTDPRWLSILIVREFVVSIVTNHGGFVNGDFDNKHLFTRVNLAYTHVKRKQINEIMMQRDKLKKKKMLRIEANNDDPNSQDVLLMVGTPVISNRNYKKLGLVNSATFVVKKIEPLLLLEDTVTNDKIEITIEQFRLYFWVNY